MPFIPDNEIATKKNSRATLGNVSRFIPDPVQVDMNVNNNSMSLGSAIKETATEGIDTLKRMTPAVKGLVSDIKQRGQNVFEAASKTGEALAAPSAYGPQTGEFTVPKGFGEKAIDVVSLAGNTAKQVAGGVGDIFTRFFEASTANVTPEQKQALLNSKPVQDIKTAFSRENINPEVMSKIDSISTAAKNNPEVADAVGGFLEVVTNLLGGGASEALGKKVVSTTGEVISDVVKTAKPVVKDVVSTLDTGLTNVNKFLDTAAENSAKRIQDKKFQEVLKDVIPLQNKVNKEFELKASLPGGAPGGVKRKGILGTANPIATVRLEEIAKDAYPYIKDVKDPLKKIQNVNQGIVDNSIKIDEFLDLNKTNSNFEDLRGYLEKNKPTFSLKGDPSASEAYTRATENSLNVLNDTLRQSAKTTGDFGPSVSGADIRKARIAIDKQIQAELGDTVFGSPQYVGIKAAAVDARNLLNRMNEDLLRYPGQLEKVNRMNEFITESKGRGIEIDLYDSKVRSQIEKSFGLNKTAESEALAQKLATDHRKLENLYIARDNMIDKNLSIIGKNPIKDWIKANPVKSKAIGFGLSTVGLGTAGIILK